MIGRKEIVAAASCGGFLLLFIIGSGLLTTIKIERSKCSSLSLAYSNAPPVVHKWLLCKSILSLGAGVCVVLVDAFPAVVLVLNLGNLTGCIVFNGLDVILAELCQLGDFT